MLAGIVSLDANDRARARECAETMVSDAHRRGWKDRWEDSVESHYLGALGEIAFARWLGIEWDCHPGDRAKADVAGYEVRTCGPRLKEIAAKSKANDRPTIRIATVALAAEPGGEVARALILGWATAETIRAKGRRRDPGGRGAPAWFLEPWHLNTDYAEA